MSQGIDTRAVALIGGLLMALPVGFTLGRAERQDQWTTAYAQGYHDGAGDTRTAIVAVTPGTDICHLARTVAQGPLCTYDGAAMARAAPPLRLKRGPTATPNHNPKEPTP